MCEILLADILIKKFPPSWSDCKNVLRHKKKDLTTQELINHMGIEETNRLKGKLDSFSLNPSKTRLIEFSMPINRDRFKGKEKQS